MLSRFDDHVGLSDHTLDNTTSIASVALGVSIIQKNITLDTSGGGPDDRFSLEQPDTQIFCHGVKSAWAFLGTVNYEPKASELANMKFRRSIYFVEDLKLGERFESHHLRCVRPDFGLAPKLLPELVGRTLLKLASANSQTTIEHFWNLS